jgi:hypothetical protein
MVRTGRTSWANCWPSTVREIVPSGPTRRCVVPVVFSSWRIWLSRVARLTPISRAACRRLGCPGSVRTRRIRCSAPGRAKAHGEAGWTGRLVPLTVDGLIYGERDELMANLAARVLAVIELQPAHPPARLPKGRVARQFRRGPVDLAQPAARLLHHGPVHLEARRHGRVPDGRARQLPDHAGHVRRHLPGRIAFVGPVGAPRPTGSTRIGSAFLMQLFVHPRCLLLAVAGTWRQGGHQKILDRRT